ncbi:winged helix-turn-helix transcriptional regulator [Microbacterium sp. No. 7]|uniref:winged helix-turn-helix transcriptional regulator n=1 Tax=Microbacterium sp. No. 7 TaxID=1714373 RepID=UPI0006D031C1|nr:winged helix-turn-helix transcriptional regulator [Microbacterium sp. No. 7]ALJ22225.1 hypothetical protein AOA12_21005 [Microbacterium sp. No. 7]
MPRRTDAFRGLAHASRFRILRAVRDNPGIGLAEISESTGLHPNTLRDHTRVLIDGGFLRGEVEHRPSRGRPRTIYFPIDADTEHEEVQRRIDEAKRHGDLLRRIADIDTGSLDPDALHQLDAVYEHLDEVGLNPDMQESELRVQLHPCRFHGLIAEHRDTVCRVHEGLIREVLHRAGGPVEVDRLDALVTPHQCQLHLRLARDE